jgi:hypothetical protein
MSALSPTRRASRATLPARGRDGNGATRRSDESFMPGVAFEISRLADAGASLPLTGRVVREANRVG